MQKLNPKITIKDEFDSFVGKFWHNKAKPDGFTLENQSGKKVENFGKNYGTAAVILNVCEIDLMEKDNTFTVEISVEKIEEIMKNYFHIFKLDYTNNDHLNAKLLKKARKPVKVTFFLRLSA